MKKLTKDFTIILLISIIFLSVISIFIIDTSSSYSELEKISLEESNRAPVSFEYGLPVDSFKITSSEIKRNQNLSDILIKQGISYAQIDKLVKISKPIFDVRKIKAGNRYSLFSDLNNQNKLLYFIYEESAQDYIKYSFIDSLTVIKGKKEVTLIKQYASGTIESSLWNAMHDIDANPILAVELSEIYAWAIDFFGIQKGDLFKVIYEEAFIDSVSIGISKIHAACFTHYGHEYWAFEFTQDSVTSFFDEDGNSLRKAFLKSPLRFSRISSRFSNSRMHPVLKIRRPHHGIDYAAPTGTPVHSIGDGVVIKKGYQKRGGGRYVKIKHNSVYTTVYMHFSKFASGITTGTRVTQGQTIGYVGRSGLATGPHLDFRVYKNGTPIDPLKLKSPPVKPIKEDMMEEYLKYTKDVQKKYILLEKMNSL